MEWVRCVFLFDEESSREPPDWDRPAQLVSILDIFSKKDEPRREDIQAKRLIKENSAIIHKLADTFSNGAFSASRKVQAAENAQPRDTSQTPSRFHIYGGSSKPTKSEPYLKVSLNGRVVIVDAADGRQISMLGQFKHKNGQKYFCLATKENGFISPIEPEVASLLEQLDGVIVENSAIEEKLLGFIQRTLDLP